MTLIADRSKTVRVLAAAALSVTALSLPAGAATLVVDNKGACSNTTGAPYCSISAAVAQAQPGDVVDVKSGTYVGRVLVNRSGLNGSPIILSSSENAVVTSTSYGFDLSGASYVTITGFTINATNYDGIRCTLCANVTISSNAVTHSNGKGIGINSSSDVLMDGNTVTDSRNTGIDIAGSTRITVHEGLVARSGQRILGKSFKGIKFSSSTDSLVDGTEVADNSDSGVYLLSGATNIRIRGVVSHHNARTFDRAAAGIESRSDGNIVEQAIAYSNEDSGINMRWGGSNGLIVNNTAYSNGDHGIDVLESPNPRIFHNSVFNNVTAGINVEGNSANAVVMNNVSVDNGLPAIRTVGNIRITTSSMPAIADYNVVWMSNGAYNYHWNGTYFRNLTSLRAVNPGVENSGLQTSPSWVDPANGNFNLMPGSAAIDSANADAMTGPEILHDALGRARCDDASTGNTGAGTINYADRGAFELTTSCGE